MVNKVSIVIPTLNAQSVLENCLISIKNQNYPKEYIEIVVADGGSSDSTLDIAKKYNALIVKNPLQTAEAGKAVGLKAATGDFIALIDSDNILPDESWLQKMIQPLVEHSEAVGSEPLEYTWRSQDGFIDRYCALLGMNDPLCLFIGNYDRTSIFTNDWTRIGHDETDYSDYLLLKFDKRGLPTIGANGTVFRKDFLSKVVIGDYLFDIDVLTGEIMDKGFVNFIKVRTGIVHVFCGSDINKFIRKQKRRVLDYMFHKKKGDRAYKWETQNSGLYIYILCCLTLIPLFVQSLQAYKKKKDYALLFHPLACEITFLVYGWGVIRSVFNNKEITRVGWKQ